MTSRPAILAAARRLIDQDGWERLTVRRLAAELGVGTTTLYHHVQGKDDLLLLLLNEFADQIGPVDLPDDPTERIVACWVALHDALAAWPWAAEVLTVDGFLGRLGDSALSSIETIIAATVELGCTVDQAVEHVRSVWYYTAGEILVRTHSRRAGAPAPNPDFLAGVDPQRLPHLAGLGTRWQDLSARDTYVEGLVAFVEGLIAQAVSANS